MQGRNRRSGARGDDQPLRIGIDYTAAVRQGAGIGRYTRHLIGTLSELDHRNQYRMLVAGAGVERDQVGSWPNNFRWRWLPVSDRWLHIFWQRFRVPMPVQVVTGPLDLFYSPDFVLPPVGRAPAIVTVHDLSFLRVPEFFVDGFCEYLTTAVVRAVSRAQRILADSESTRRDLIELLGVAGHRIRVVYPGVEERFKPIVDAGILQDARRHYGLPERFVLGLGTLQPRKNFSGLIRAYGQLIRERACSPEVENLHLVIAGGAGWMHDATIQMVGRLGLEGRVHFLGYMDDKDLPALYSLARVFAFPSWYEGFGLPVLEAMACGVPVVAADNSSLTEVVGEAGILVDAGDTKALSEGICRLCEDTALRARAIAAGRAQAARFSWAIAAAALLAEFEKLGRLG